MTQIGPGNPHYVYTPFIKTVMGYPVTLDSNGDRIVILDTKQAKCFKDFPMIGLERWEALSSDLQHKINELVGGRIIPHHLTPSDLTIGPYEHSNLLFSEINDVAPYGVTGSPPELSSSSLGQVHFLNSSDLVISSPEFPQLWMYRDKVLANDLVSSPAVIDDTDLTQKNNLYALWSYVTGRPSITPAIFVIDLLSEGLDAPSPIISSPTFVDLLSPYGLAVGSPELGQPSILSNKIITPLSLAIGLPIVGISNFPLSVFSATLGFSGNTDRQETTVAILITKALLPDNLSGKKVRVTFNLVTNSVIGNAFIGYNNPAGQPYDCLSLTRLTFNGNNYSGDASTHVSDFVDFIYDGTKDLVVRFFLDSDPSPVYVKFGYKSGAYSYLFYYTDYSSLPTMSAPVNTTFNNYSYGIPLVEIL